MIIDSNILAYQYGPNQFTPNKVYPSGEKNEDNINNLYNKSKHKPALLIIEDDIINKDGAGLKKGFYNVLPDKYLDFLYIYQSGNLKAKVPIAHVEVFENIDLEQPKKPKKMSYKKFLAQQEKEKQKYIRGQNPSEVDYKEAQIHYIDEQKSYLIIYNANNIEVSAVMKF